MAASTMSMAAQPAVNTGSIAINGSDGVDIGLYPSIIMFTGGQVNASMGGTIHSADAVAKAVQKIPESSSVCYEPMIYNISVSENTQRIIWDICQKNNLSYELVLAIYKIEGNTNAQIDSIKADIGKLIYLRDYWAEQEFPDDIVFNLMLLSRQRGIEGCIIFMNDNASFEHDDYVQKVTEYKYYLEQIQSDSLFLPANVS